MYRQGCRYKAAGCPEYQNTKLKSITQKIYLYMMILISIVFFFSEIYERSYGNCFPAFPQKVLPAPLVCTAFHHSHRNPRAEDPMFPQLSACWRWTELHTCCRLPAVLILFVVPGTMRTCQKFLIQYNKQQLHRMLPKCKNKGRFFLCRICAWWILLNLFDSDVPFAEEEKEVRRAILSCSISGEKMGFKGEESDEEQGDTWRWQMCPPHASA